LKEVKFLWKRKKPEDFIVKEVSEFPLDDGGNFYLYLLVKRNLTTREVCKPLGLSYAGMKDKFALTFQKVSSEKFLGEFKFENLGSGKWFMLKLIGKVKRKVRIGNLKGNKFAVNVSGFDVKHVDSFVNYYDVQRISGNALRGREVLRRLSKKPRRKLPWIKDFFLDSYLSFLWNKSLELFLKEKFPGYYVVDRGERFFLPEGLAEIPRFWAILGYKVKLLHSEGYYRRVLEEEGWELEEVLLVLKKLGIKGDYRRTLVVPQGVKKIGNYLFFSLPKGSFATMFLKNALG